MQNLWNDADAQKMIEYYAARGVNEDLALRTYSSRLLGGDPRLVQHGGGNTSVKTVLHDLYGDEVKVVCVKGSGRDLSNIEPGGHPAVRLEPLFHLKSLEKLFAQDRFDGRALSLNRSGFCLTSPILRLESLE